MSKPAPKSFHLRLPHKLYARIEAVAATTNRSATAEIVRALEEAFPSPNVDVLAVDSVMNYVATAPNAAEMKDRLEEVNERFVNSGSNLRIVVQPNGTLTIITED